MYHSYVLAQSNEDGTVESCAGPLTGNDIQEYFKLHPNEKNDYQIVDEMIFKILHPAEHKELIESDIAMAINVWLDEMYKGEKPMRLDDNMVFTKEYTIEVLEEEVTLFPFKNCPPTESAEVVMLLQDKLCKIRTIKVKQTTVFIETEATMN